MTTADEATDEKQGLPVVAFAAAADWEAWLEEHHADSRGIWLKFAKKGSGATTVTYAEAVEDALCYGWIDGQAAPLDDAHWLQRFTPRRPKSPWSARNRMKVDALVAAGRMRPAGTAAVEQAKRDGRWDRAYEPPSTATVPDDLQRALDASPEAAAAFAILNKTNRYAVLYRIQDAKKPETRARRIETFVAMLARGEKLYP